MADATAPRVLIGIPEIAKHLGRTERQVSWMIECGTLPVFRLGARWAMTEDGYQQLIAARSAAALERVK